MKVCAECVRPGGPLKVRRTSGKCKVVAVQLQKLDSTALVPIAAAGDSTALVPISILKRPAVPASSDQRGRQASRSRGARHMETARKKQQQQQQQLQKEIRVVAPLLELIRQKEEENAALRLELSQVRSELASVARDNWRDGVAMGRRGWGSAPTTPSSRARAGRVCPA